MAALQNLVKIMSLYYQYMETYMGPALFAVRPHTDKHVNMQTLLRFISLKLHLDLFLGLKLDGTLFV